MNFSYIGAKDAIMLVDLKRKVKKILKDLIGRNRRQPDMNMLLHFKTGSSQFDQYFKMLKPEARHTNTPKCELTSNAWGISLMTHELTFFSK